jgi:hypothetical protein
MIAREALISSYLLYNRTILKIINTYSSLVQVDVHLLEVDFDLHSIGFLLFNVLLLLLDQLSLLLLEPLLLFCPLCPLNLLVLGFFICIF